MAKPQEFIDENGVELWDDIDSQVDDLWYEIVSAAHKQARRSNIIKKGSSRSGNWGHSGKAGMHGGSNAGGGHGSVSSSKVPGGTSSKKKPKVTATVKKKPKASPKKSEPKVKTPDKKPERKAPATPPHVPPDGSDEKIIEFSTNFDADLGKIESNISAFEAQQKADADYKKLLKNQEEWAKSVSDEEKDAIYAYSTIRYYEFSERLRGSALGNAPGRNSQTPEIKNQIHSIDAALDRATLPTDLTLYRGANGNRYQDLKPGDTFVDKSFISTTVDWSMAQSFASEQPNPVIIKIDAPKGSRGAFIGTDFLSMVPEEAEVLLPRQTAFQVKEFKGGVLHVELVRQYAPDDPAMEFKMMLKMVFSKLKESKKKKKKFNRADRFVWQDDDIEIIKKPEKPKKR